MSNYTKLTDFASKDALPSGNANKIVKGTEIDDEFEALVTAVATKADLASPTLTGTPAAPTATVGTDTTQIATTAFVQDAVEKAGFVGTTQLAADAVTNAKLADDAVDSAQIADGAVDSVHLAADVVTGAKIADDAVDTEHLAADAVDAAAIADNAVGAAALNVSGNGTSGQVLKSDGDGSFSWAAAATGKNIVAISNQSATQQGSAPTISVSGVQVGDTVAVSVDSGVSSISSALGTGIGSSGGVGDATSAGTFTVAGQHPGGSEDSATVKALIMVFR